MPKKEVKEEKNKQTNETPKENNQKKEKELKKQSKTTSEKSKQENKKQSKTKTQKDQKQSNTKSKQENKTNTKNANQKPKETIEVEDLKETAKKIKDKTKEVLEDVKDKSKSYTKSEKEEGRALSVVCYLLPPIPYFLEEKNKFVKFHAAQGMNLLFVTVVYWLLITFIKSLIKIKVACESLGLLTYQEYCEITPAWIEKPLNMLSIIFAVYAIIGIIYALQGKAKELPVLNKLKVFK